jgi:hypothetical protein
MQAGSAASARSARAVVDPCAVAVRTFSVSRCRSMVLHRDIAAHRLSQLSNNTACLRSSSAVRHRYGIPRCAAASAPSLVEASPAPVRRDMCARSHQSLRSSTQCAYVYVAAVTSTSTVPSSTVTGDGWGFIALHRERAFQEHAVHERHVSVDGMALPVL